VTARRAGATASDAAVAAEDALLAALSAVFTTVPTALPTTSADRVSMSSACPSRSSDIRPPLTKR
jgi:hypothetical protein